MHTMNKQAAKDWRKHYKDNHHRLQKMMKTKMGVDLNDWFKRMAENRT